MAVVRCTADHEQHASSAHQFQRPQAICDPALFRKVGLLRRIYRRVLACESGVYEGILAVHGRHARAGTCRVTSLKQPENTRGFRLHVIQGQ